MIQLSDHFTYRRLLRFTSPSIIMMVFTSIYGVADGFFVSNYVGKTSFAAVNFIMPLLMILGCVGFMFGTGGGALIAKTMGEGKDEKAREWFSLIVYTSIACGVLLSALGFALLRPFASFMGADGQLLEDCVIYGRVILLALPFFILQFEFQCLFSTAEKPKFGLAVTVVAGSANIVMDALFTAAFHWGLPGAAAATAVSQCIGGMIPLIYFGRKNGSRLQLVKCSFDGRVLGKACVNGSSELMSNISMSLVSMLYNVQLMKYAGENGIAAYGVLMYVGMIFQAIYIGYSVGAAPIIGYHYGAGNKEELKGLLKKSMALVAVCAVFMFASGQIFSRPLSHLFVGYDAELFSVTANAFSIFSYVFLFSGFAIFCSSFFTALNDGLTSAAISFLRTLLFQCAAVLLFPLFLGIDGIWLSTVAAEVMAVAVSFLFLACKRRAYQY